MSGQLVVLSLRCVLVLVPLRECRGLDESSFGDERREGGDDFILFVRGREVSVDVLHGGRDFSFGEFLDNLEVQVDGVGVHSPHPFRAPMKTSRSRPVHQRRMAPMPSVSRAVCGTTRMPAPVRIAVRIAMSIILPSCASSRPRSRRTPVWVATRAGSPGTK